MAQKPFYSLPEASAKLGKSEDEIKDLVREGSLREFRDAGKVFFKAEDIDKLAGGADNADEIVLDSGSDDASDDTDVPPVLTESSGGTSIIGLEPLEDDQSDDDDEPSPTPSDESSKDDTAVTASGIGVFDDDELEIDADPMAKTQITTGASEEDQISLEGAGSGSGLLDLAREADDTALGADLLDEIYPGEEEAEPTAEEEESTAEEPATAEEEAEEEAELEEPVAVATTTTAVAIPAGDPSEALFSGMLVAGIIIMAVASTVVAGLLQGFLPDYAHLLSDGTNFYFFLGGAVLLMVLAIVLGWFFNKAFAPRRR